MYVFFAVTHLSFRNRYTESSPISRFLLMGINEYIVLFDSSNTQIHSILAVSGV